MKINIQKSNERGSTRTGWLHSRHSFSFGNYYNPKKISFGLLRVLNDDIIEPGKGFGMHFHDNMEIVSIVLEGALEHKDSMNNHGVIRTGEVQRISAGTGISHSEFNHSGKEKAHFLQIWIEPKDMDLKPSYEQKRFLIKKNELVILVSGNKSDKSMYIHQDAYFSIGNFDNGKTIEYILKNSKNGVFVFVIYGRIAIGNKKMDERDSAEITETSIFKFKAEKKSKILIIEVPLK